MSKELFKIIFNLKDVQYCSEIEKSGGVTDEAEIIWDERYDGELDDSLVQYIGALVKIDDGVAVDLEKYDALQQQEQVSEQATTDRETEMNECVSAFESIDDSKVDDDVKILIKGLAYKVGVI